MAKTLLFSILCCALMRLSSGVGIPYSYAVQNLWPPVCNAGNTGRQSPINIIVADVVQDASLSSLVLNSGWDSTGTIGTLANTGYTVKFTLNESSPEVTTNTPVRNYRVGQFHFHWGSSTGMGSEHLINGNQAELEIHFVHNRIVAGEPGQANAVIGILADVSDEAIGGIWELLNVSRISNTDDSFYVTGIVLSDLLPDNRDYYYYEGSLTTPNCTESVQWFVLKNRITVPSAYLELLRSLNGVGGPITENFRDVQDLNGREVTTQSSALMTRASILAVFCLLTLQLLTIM